MNLEADLINFVADLQGKVRDCLPERQPLLQTSHKRNGTIFRGHPCFRGNVWRDWVVIDWGDEGRLPNKICGFLDLTSANMPHDHGMEHAGTDIEAAVCAIVENAAHVEVDNARSEIFVRITKEVGGLADNRVSHLTFYLADAEASMEPISVIPDIGASKMRFQGWLPTLVCNTPNSVCLQG